METLQILLQIVQTLGGAGTIIVVLVALYLYQQGFFKRTGDGKYDDLLLAMHELKSHFNDETTEELKSIRDGVGRVEEGVKQANAGIATVNIQVGKARGKLEEIEKYGVVIRKT